MNSSSTLEATEGAQEGAQNTTDREQISLASREEVTAKPAQPKTNMKSFAINADPIINDPIQSGEIFGPWNLVKRVKKRRTNPLLPCGMNNANNNKSGSRFGVLEDKNIDSINNAIRTDKTNFTSDVERENNPGAAYKSDVGPQSQFRATSHFGKGPGKCTIMKNAHQKTRTSEPRIRKMVVSASSDPKPNTKIAASDITINKTHEAERDARRKQEEDMLRMMR